MFVVRFIFVLSVIVWSLVLILLVVDSDELLLEDYFFSFVFCYGWSYLLEYLNVYLN